MYVLHVERGLPLRELLKAQGENNLNSVGSASVLSETSKSQTPFSEARARKSYSIYDEAMGFVYTEAIEDIASTEEITLKVLLNL